MNSVPLKIILADDDTDDCEFFKEALDELSVQAHLTVFNDGIKLMKHLHNIDNALPDVLFLDINMPCKNGHECLLDIKTNDRLKHIPVIMISTSIEKEMVKMSYQHGAHNYLQKPSNFNKLKISISEAIADIEQNTEPHAL